MGLIAGAGVGLALLLTVAMPLFIWFGEGWILSVMGRALQEIVGRSLCTGLIVAGFLCLGPLIMQPKLKLGGGIVQWVTLTCLFCAATMMTAEIWGWSFFEGDLVRDLERVLCVALILGGAGALCVWGFHRLTTLRAAMETKLEGAVHLRCPRCQKEQEVATGEARCVVCGLRFHVDVEEPVCVKCGYRLYGDVERCPECGAGIKDCASVRAPGSGQDEVVAKSGASGSSAASAA
jgi:hypothetical protein